MEDENGNFLCLNRNLNLKYIDRSCHLDTNQIIKVYILYFEEGKVELHGGTQAITPCEKHITLIDHL